MSLRVQSLSRWSFLVFLLIIVAGVALPFAALRGQDCTIAAGSSDFERGVALFECGDYAAAIEVFEALLDTTSEAVERADIQIYYGQALLAIDDALNAQIAFERALAAYRQAGLVQQEGVALYHLGRAKLARNLEDEALTFFNQGVRAAAQSGDDTMLVLLHLAIGDIQTARVELEDAQQSYEAALAAAERDSDTAQQAVLLLRLGDNAFAQGLVVNAADLYQRGLEAAEAAGSVYEQAYVQYRLGVIEHDQGRLASARARLENAIEQFGDLDRPLDVEFARAELGSVLVSNGEYEAADDLLQDVLEYALDEDNCELIVQTRIYRADMDIESGGYIRAQMELNRADERECVQTNNRLRAYVRLLNGRALAEAGNQVIAREQFQFALTAFRDANDRLGERQALIGVGQTTIALFDLEDGLSFLYTAQAVAEETQSVAGEIEVLLAFAEADVLQFLFDDALERYRTALDMAEQSENVVMQSRALDGLLEFYFIQGRYDEAIAFFEDAITRYTSANIPVYQAHIVYFRGLQFQANGEFELAETQYNRALAAFEEADNREGAMRVRLSQGDLAMRLQEYERAQELFDDVLGSASISGNLLLSALAESYLGDIELLLWDESVVTAVEIDAEEEARVLEQATRYYLSAFVTYELLGDQNGIAETINRLGAVGLRGGPISTNAGFTGLIQRALDIARELGNRRLEADALYNLAEWSFQLPNLSQARTYFNQITIVAGDVDPLLTARAQVRLAQIAENQGDMVTAVREFEEAIVLIEALYASFQTEARRINIGEESLFLLPYERLARYYSLQRNDGQETTLTLAERSRARSYLFQLSEQSVDFGSDDNTALARWRSARNEVLRLTEQLAAQPSGDTPETQAILTELEAAQAELEALGNQLDEGALQQFIGINVATLDEVRAALPADTAMLVYYVLPNVNDGYRTEAGRVLTWVITQDSLTMATTRVESYEADVVDTIDTFLRAYSDVQGSALYNMLVAPVETQLAEYEHLVIVPHNVLNYLPFEALVNAQGERLLAQFASITYAPSATVYTLLQAQAAQRVSGDNSLLMAYGDDLPFIEAEVEAVGAIVDSTPVIADEATETLLRTRISSADLVHIAAHGDFIPYDPLQSRIRLAADGTNDGMLTVQEIYGLPLREHSPLIVLSACQTAVSSLNPGDEIEGMTRAFLLSGARGVIASLWAVNDTATALLMTAFYENRAAGMSDAEALLAAKLTLSENPTTADPYYWAAFVLIGSNG